jgi:large subunit ribosomal protein L15
MVYLNELCDNDGAKKNRIRVGRGIGSGKGKTCGRGGKGQKARTGVAINGFEGGQMPIFRRLPKRGFNNIFKKHFELVKTSDINAILSDNTINRVDVKLMLESGLVKKNNSLVKLLFDEELSRKVDLELDAASASARSSVEKVGGSILVRT